MIKRNIIAGLSAVALAATPIAASAAQPLSLAASPEMRAGAATQQANGLYGDDNTIYIIAGVVVAALIILWATDTWPFDDDDSDSP